MIWRKKNKMASNVITEEPTNPSRPVPTGHTHRRSHTQEVTHKGSHTGGHTLNRPHTQEVTHKGSHARGHTHNRSHILQVIHTTGHTHHRSGSKL